MKQYLTVLFCGSLLGALCTAAAGARLEKYLRYLSALLCILLIVSPFREFDLEPGEEGLSAPPAPLEGETLEGLSVKLAEEELCRTIAAQLSAGTGITPVKLSIDIDWTAEEPVITAVRLFLSPEENHRGEEAAAWAEAAYGVPCYVTEGEEPPCP